MRKPIAVSTTLVNDVCDGDLMERIVTTVVCDDGSIWRCIGDDEWYHLDPLPQKDIPSQLPAEDFSDFDDFPELVT